MNRINLIFLFLSSAFLLEAQDSLLKKFNSENDIRKKVLTGLELVNEYRDKGMPGNGIIIGNDILALAKKNKLSNLVADCYSRVAVLYDDIASYDTATLYSINALEIHLSLKMDKNTANDYTALGGIYYSQSLYVKSLECYLKSMAIREKIKDLHGLGQNYNNIANIYKDLDNYSVSYRYRVKALNIFKKENHLRGIGSLLSNLAYDLGSMQDSARARLGFTQKQREDTTIAYYRQAYAIFEKVQMPEGIAAVLGNMGLYYTAINKHDSGIICEKKSYEIYKQIGSKIDMAGCLGDMSKIYVAMKNYKEAVKVGLEAKVLAEETGNRFALDEIYKNLYGAYKGLNKMTEALLYHEKWKINSDSLKGEQENRALTTKALQYEFDKKAAADSIKNDEEKKVKDAEIHLQQLQLKQEKNQRYVLFGGVALLLMFGVFMFNRFKVTQRQRNIIALQQKETEKQKHIIEEKQKEILDSIYYARRIQRSLMSNEKYIYKTLQRLRKFL